MGIQRDGMEIHWGVSRLSLGVETYGPYDVGCAVDGIGGAWGEIREW